MERVTRRRFVVGLGAGWIAATIAPLAFAAGKRTPRAILRIRPLDSDLCSPSFAAYCRRTRFSSVEKAITIAHRTPHRFEIYREPVVGADVRRPPSDAGTQSNTT